MEIRWGTAPTAPPTPTPYPDERQVSRWLSPSARAVPPATRQALAEYGVRMDQPWIAPMYTDPNSSWFQGANAGQWGGYYSPDVFTNGPGLQGFIAFPGEPSRTSLYPMEHEQLHGYVLNRLPYMAPWGYPHGETRQDQNGLLNAEQAWAKILNGYTPANRQLIDTTYQKAPYHTAGSFFDLPFTEQVAYGAEIGLDRVNALQPFFRDFYRPRGGWQYQQPWQK